MSFVMAKQNFYSSFYYHLAQLYEYVSAVIAITINESYNIPTFEFAGYSPTETCSAFLESLHTFGNGFLRILDIITIAFWKISSPEIIASFK